ncbi:MAG: SDR family NAD(P)-dependent oxidoreductase [Actinobacteria bacterium]|nr:SDR family NAD(P)-dependent oxidoreductase [Actinomycetota bacterium]
MIAAITGASSGIGYEVARALQDGGHQLVVIGRDPARHAAILKGDDVFVECELAVSASVTAAAETIKRRFPQLDLLINNAGVAGRRGLTIDGFELAFAVNYLSHYLLTRLLGNPRRVVNVSSEAHRGVTDLDPDQGLGPTRSLLGWREYQYSKAAQIAFTHSLVSRGFDAYSVHPGVLATNLWRRVPAVVLGPLTRRMKPPAAGALPVLRAATDTALDAGDYVTPRGVIAPTPLVSNPEVAERLWQQSEKWVAAYIP